MSGRDARINARLAHIQAGGAPKSATRLEQENQKAAVTWLRYVLPRGSLVYHVPNGGYRRKAEAGILKGMGVLAGVPDVVCALPGGVHVYFEFKAPDGVVSADQSAIHKALEKAGHRVGVVETLDDCRRYLRQWGIRTMEAGLE